MRMQHDCQRGSGGGERSQLVLSWPHTRSIPLDCSGFFHRSCDPQAAAAAAAPHPADFFDTVLDRDAKVVLTLPGDAEEAAGSEERTTRGAAKRRRTSEPPAAAPAVRVIEHGASAQFLKSASPKFR